MWNLIRTYFVPLLWCVIVSGPVAIAQSPGRARPSVARAFIENNGQIRDQNGQPNRSVRYLLSTGNGMNIQLLNHGFSYDTWQRDTTADNTPPAKAPKLLHPQKPSTLRFHRVDIEFEGSNANPQLIADGLLPQQLNYSTGTLKGPQTIQVSQYTKITYKELYPHIDLIFQFNSDTGRLFPEYNFIVHPGGDPNNIRWKYHGALATSLTGGSIQLSVSHGKIKEHIPACFQDKAVPCRFRTVKQDTYSFNIAHFDRSKDLTIDPTPDLLWGTYYGGEGVDWLYADALCPDGGVVFGGTAGSAYNIATAGSYQTTLQGYSDGMLGKFTSDGKLLWATYYGGSESEDLYGITVDKDNNVYALGDTWSNSGIATPGAFKTTRTAYAGCTNGFLAKFTGTGQLVWGTYYGGEMLELPYAITIDHNNDILFCGGTTSMTGIASPGAWQSTYAGGSAGQQVGAEDVFIAKFTADGARVWSTYYGGAGFDRGYGIAVDPDDNIFLTGNTMNAGLSTAGTFQPAIDAVGTQSSFLSKWTSAGSLIWGTYFGKGGYPNAGGVGLGVTSDKYGNAYVVGTTCCASNIGTPGTLQPSISAPNQYGDGFLMKFDKNGGRQWGTYVGGTASDWAYGVTCDGDNGIWITGFLGTPTNAVTPGSYQPNTVANATAYICKFDAGGTRLWGTYYGIAAAGNYSGEGRAIVNDGLGNVFVVGHTGVVTTNIATCGAVQPTNTNEGDGFVAKFGQATIPSVQISADHSGTICPGKSVTLSAQTQNGGASPSFQWLVNGTPVAGNASTEILTNLADGDVVQCMLVLNPACATGSYPSNTLSFHVDAGLPPSVLISGQAGTICPGVEADFVAVPTNGGDQPLYQWTVNGIPEGTNSDHFSSATLANSDIVQCKLTHQGSCIPDSIADSNPIPVSIYPTPSFGLSISADNAKACQGTPITFTADPSGSNSRTFQWEVNGTPVGTNTPTYTSSQLKDGDLVVCKLTVSDAQCTYPAASSNSIPVTIDPLPVIAITGDSIITKGKSTELSVQASGDPLFYAWTPDSAISDPSIADPVVSPVVTTTYTVKVTSGNNCSATASFTVKVILRITVPNAFTPNADGRNDVFRASYGSDISNVRFFVYDRWGQLVFTSRGNSIGWDGTYEGKPQAPGTYVWMFEYKDSSGATKVLNGTVELIR